MHRKAFLRLVAGSACTPLLSGCGGTRKASHRKLRVSSTPYLSMSPLYLAHELGLFSEVGLDVEIHQIVGYGERMPLLMRRELDVVFLALHPSLIAAVERGAKIRIVLGRERASTNCGIGAAVYGRRSIFPDGLHDLRLLKGRRVSVGTKTGLGEFYTELLLRNAGMTFSDIQPVYLRERESFAALVSGKIDAMTSTYSESDFEAKATDVVRGVSLGELFPDFQYSHAAFGPSLLKRDREIGVRFLFAYLHGAREFLAGRTPKYFDELARATGRDPEVARNDCRSSFATDGSIDQKSIEIYVDWAFRRDYCVRRIPAKDLVDDSFVVEANRRYIEQFGA